MKMADIARLRGKAKRTTHLARYEHAIDTGAVSVLDRWCPYCGARDGEQCHEKM
jgi:hypothetical protein